MDTRGKKDGFNNLTSRFNTTLKSDKLTEEVFKMGIFNIKPKDKAMKGKMLLIVMKADRSSPVFVSTGFLGEVVSRSGAKIELKNCCIVYEQAGRNQVNGELILRTQYYSHSQISSGNPIFREEDVLWERLIDVELEQKEFLSGYYQAIEAYKAEKEKSGIIRATQIPPDAQMPQGRN